MLFRDGEEVCGTAEGIGDRAGRGEGFGGTLGFGDDEASAYGVEDFCGDWSASTVVGGEAHSVGVRGDGGVGVHLVAVEEEIFGLDEGDGLLAAEVDGVCVADGCDFGFDGGGVNGVGGFAEEAEENGAVGSVAYAGEGERAVEIDGDRKSTR